MPIGSPRTEKFSIGTAELRIGPLASAGRLGAANSMGLIDDATVTVAQESVDLEGGLPKKLVATAIVRQTSEISATLREYSRRNINVMLGNGVSASEPAAVSTTVDNSGSPVAAAAVSLPLASAAGLAAGDLLVAYNVGRPEDAQVLEVDSISTNVVTLATHTPILVALEDGAPVFLANQVAVGAVSKTNYFSCMVLGQDFSTGAPTIWNFWKAAISSGLEYQTNASDFASTGITIKSLEPSAADTGTGGPLEDFAAQVAAHPVGYGII